MAFIDDIVISGDLKSIHIDAWQREVYFKQFTLSDNDWIQKKSGGKDGDFIAYFLIRKCLDDKGERLFTVADIMKLTKSCNSDELTKVMLEIRGEDVDYEGNS